MYHTLALLALCGCTLQSSPTFMGQTPYQLVAGGRHYDLYRRGDDFEIIRHGFARPKDHEIILETMMKLTEQTTGCTISRHGLKGDSGVMRGRLRCPK